MSFDIPQGIQDYLVELDDFIEREIKPLEQQDDNIRFFDHRREDARTDWDRGGLPSEEWEALLAEARRRADAAGHYRYPLPKAYGGQDVGQSTRALDKVVPLIRALPDFGEMGRRRVLGILHQQGGDLNMTFHGVVNKLCSEGLL